MNNDIPSKSQHPQRSTTKSLATVALIVLIIAAAGVFVIFAQDQKNYEAEVAQRQDAIDIANRNILKALKEMQPLADKYR